MPNRLADAVSPYLRSHADNPVDWWQWGPEAFAEAVRRDVPVLISIGYATCHWCHVMARESLSDAGVAAYLNANFVSIKVDREEHPDVDTSYLAAAGAFTDQLGWPLTAFATPQGRTFFAGTYFPPVQVGDRASFRQVLEAVVDAWTSRRDQVESDAGRLAEAIRSAIPREAGALPDAAALAACVEELAGYEDRQFGGFGGAPKFPVAPTLGFLLRVGRTDDAAHALATRTLSALAASPLRDSVEGGFFRYATRRDWTDPHYERMLYDNALLLESYSRAGSPEVASGIADFLLAVLRVPPGAFASAQDSESVVDGERVEGGYYALAAEQRANQAPPALDDKVLTGWNGLAIGALASAGFRLDQPAWIDAATTAARVVLGDYASTGTLLRARVGDRPSTARPTLEDYGMLAAGLLALALATGDAHWAVLARRLVDDCMAANSGSAPVFRVPGGADDVLTAHGLALEGDPSEGAYPSGLSAICSAALTLDALGAGRRYGDAARAAMAPVASLATQRPLAFGAALEVFARLAEPQAQLVVVRDDGDSQAARDVASAARSMTTPAIVTIVDRAQAAAFVTAGFELFEARTTVDGAATAYLCEDFVCRLPVTSGDALRALLEPAP